MPVREIGPLELRCHKLGRLYSSGTAALAPPQRPWWRFPRNSSRAVNGCIPSQKTKRVQRNVEGEALGVRIDGTRGVIAPPRDRVADVIGLMMHVLSAPHFSSP